MGTSTMGQDPNRPVVRVTELGEFIRFDSCERRLKLGFDNRAEARRLPFAERLFNTIDPVLKESGRRREQEWEEQLIEAGYVHIASQPDEGDGASLTWKELCDHTPEIAAGSNWFAREVALGGEIGEFQIAGRVDFVLGSWSEGVPTLRLVEGKASRKDRTYHQIQLALYAILVESEMAQTPLVMGTTEVTSAPETVVARIDESTDVAQSILDLEPLDLTTELADVRRLLSENGTVTRVHGSSLDELPYRLDAKCDDCVFSIHCLPETARRRGLELLSLEPAQVRALREAGIATIDDLAELNPKTDERVSALRTTDQLTVSPEVLHRRAVARRKTLPGGEYHPDEYEVAQYPIRIESLLPEHLQGGVALTRIFLVVEYDYTEDRIGGLAAHVTSSDKDLRTGFTQRTGGGFVPDPVPYQEDAGGTRSPVQGVTIAEFAQAPWTGDYIRDTEAEQALIVEFVRALFGAVEEVAPSQVAPVHVYVWSSREITNLMDACARVGGGLLGALRDLLGCRESLEQLIYSPLHDEADRRYGLGWTGRGLAPVTSLRWFGQRFHWVRSVNGSTYDLDRVFEQDIFDFKTELKLRADGRWATESEDVPSHKFEIRSRFRDSMSAPYWRARWGTLPDPDAAQLPAELRSAIRRYRRAAERGLIEAYLKARTESLRWIEERVLYRNPEIEKPSIDTAALASFELGVVSVDRAAIDFLRLDQHVKATQWIARGMLPRRERVTTGETLPLQQVSRLSARAIECQIATESFDVGLPVLARRISFAEGDFVRVSPASGDPDRGQTLRQLTVGGWTGVIDHLDLDAGTAHVSVIPAGAADEYVLVSRRTPPDGEVMDFASLDTSVTDFVARRVEGRLRAQAGNHLFSWLDPTSPTLPSLAPLDDDSGQIARTLVEQVAVSGSEPLMPDQAQAVLQGLSTRAQLLLGPPGTGKTTTTAFSLLLRVLLRLRPGDLVVIAGTTHTAVDTLLGAVDRLLPAMSAAAEASRAMPPIRLVKLHENGPGGTVQNVGDRPNITTIRELRAQHVLIAGGTTNAAIRFADTVDNSRDGPCAVSELVVDEASMMVFAHFLAIATMLGEDGNLLVAGDHRQLQPIVAHDWDEEERPPALIYQTHLSAYAAMRRLAADGSLSASAIQESSLTYSFRLPPEVRALINRVYRPDNVVLAGRPGAPSGPRETGDPLAEIWRRGGLYLVVHDERRSQKANHAEVQIIRALLERGQQTGSSTAVVTPHRAQRALLREALEGIDIVDLVDTVERLQGGERPTIVMSGTVSDPSAIAARAEFILSLNRANVAFSRARDRLVVVCAQSLIDHIPSDAVLYEAAALWKALREQCSAKIDEATIAGTSIAIWTTPS